MDEKQERELAAILALAYLLLRARKTRPWTPQALFNAVTTVQWKARRAALLYAQRTGAVVPSAEELPPVMSRQAMAAIMKGANPKLTLITEGIRTYGNTLKYVRFPEGQWVRVWNARLEACKHCAALHGSEAPLGGDFPGGDEPGWIHPNCRCFVTFRRVG